MKRILQIALLSCACALTLSGCDWFLSEEEFARTNDGDLVTIQHGGCREELEHLVLFWDLWVFGPLHRGLLRG